MHRWTGLIFVVALLGTLGLVVAKAGPRAASTTKSGADAGTDAASTSTKDAGASEPADAEAPAVDPLAPDLEAPTSDAGTTLLNGDHAPPLTTDAPKSVLFGVILVQYKGAQGAGPNARSREAALDLAKQLASEAKTDFKATVAKGDKGSFDNAGRMPRNMLEPAPEYVLFSLAKDGVSEPVDSPRGYLILHRIE